MPRPNKYPIERAIKTQRFSVLTPEQWEDSLSRIQLRHLKPIAEQLADTERLQGPNWDRVREICHKAMLTRQAKWIAKHGGQE